MSTVLLLWPMVASTIAADELLSAGQFTHEAARVLLVKEPHFEVTEVRPLEIQYQEPGKSGTPQHMYLDNAYKEYQAQPDQLKQILAAHVRGVEVAASMPACTSGSVLPSLKNREFVEGTRQLVAKLHAENPNSPAAQKPAPFPITEPLVGDLFVTYVIDTPDATLAMTAEKLAQCGVEQAALPKLAADNLRAKARDFSVVAIPQLPGISGVSGDRYYETALLVLDDYWDKTRFPFKGDIVVAVPARGMLLVTDSADQGAVDRLSGVAHKLYANQAYNLSPDLFIRRDGAWVMIRN